MRQFEHPVTTYRRREYETMVNRERIRKFYDDVRVFGTAESGGCKLRVADIVVLRILMVHAKWPGGLSPDAIY